MSETRSFSSISQFVGFLSSAIAAMPKDQYTALEQAALLVKAEAKAELGNYQGAAGPFAAWAPLKPATIARKRNGDTPLLETGKMRDSIEHTVQGHTAWVGSNYDVAVYQELGTRNMPPRSFLGGAAVRKEKEIVELLGATTVRQLLGRAFWFSKITETVRLR
ncbi:hypothetical protein [uncultured Alsobacter sp.]|uniref:hypothetical protein n=1 Tax=uncultured Alsobacter sp. TaxID=1748258 RepID=UPI0025CF84FF|nr:hypothetical protein [uncultured Alsobacter sp.]